MTTRFFVFPNEAAFLARMPKDFKRNGESGAPLPEGVEAIRIWPGPFARRGEFRVQPGGGVEVIKPHKVSPGLHVNLLGEVPQSWAAFEVFPKQPMCVFGGEE